MLQELDPLKQIRDLAGSIRDKSDGIANLINQLVGLTGDHQGEDVMSDNIADSVEFLRYFIDAAPLLAIELLPLIDDPIMIRTTTALETIFGYAPGELNEQPISILIPPDKRPPHKSHILGFLTHPTDRQMGEDVKPEGITKDGRRFPIVLTWKRFFVTRRPFLAATVMPQLEEESVQEMKVQIEELKRQLSEAKKA